MIIRVNRESCNGCGVCVEACSVEAIQLVEQQAVIDNALCTQCEACIPVCPNGSITAFSMPASSTSIVALPVIETSTNPAPIQKALPESAAPARGLAPLAGVALAFLGHEVAPRLADMLLTVLERKLAQPVTITNAPVSTSSRSHTAPGRHEQRQIRYRGGSSENGN